MPSDTMGLALNTISFFHLHVADFCIVLDFSKIETPRVKKNIMQMIYLHYHAYIFNNCGKPPSYKIKFVSTDEIDFSTKKHEKYIDYYIRLFHFKKKTIHTYEHISIAHLQLLMKILIQRLLLQTDGFLFHASSVIDKEGLLIFAGPNTAGKSTIARGLTDRYRPFTDDTLIVRKRKNVWCGYQMPVDVNDYIYDRNAMAVPVKAIFFLNKDTKLAVKRINKNNIDITLFMNQLSVGTAYKNHVRSLFNFVAKIEQVFKLRFPKNIDGVKFEACIKSIVQKS